MNAEATSDVGEALASPTADVVVGWGSSPREAFMAILTNRGKAQTPPVGPVRTRGFVVLARNTDSLQAVQEWCSQQTWNDCLAARYRIKSRPVFGTLFAALNDDSEQLREARHATSAVAAKTSGRFLFGSQSAWPAVFARGFFDDPTSASRVSAWLEKPQGEIASDSVQNLLRFLTDDSVLPSGRRLVLLAEVVGEPRPEEWEAAKAGLFEVLPERIGLVLSGAPEGFSLAGDDPHYLELDLDGVEATPGPDAYVYKRAALKSDRPSEEDDWLGFAPYAEALARLVRHPGTGPLTIAIHGSWGKGKSQFMKLVSKSLRAPAATDEETPATKPSLPSAAEEEEALAEEAEPVVIWFNAWRYQDSTQIWAGLASTVTRGLEAKLPPWRRRLTPLAYAWKDYRFELIVELALPIALAGLILALAAVGILHLNDWLQQQLRSDAFATLLGGVLPAFGVLLGTVWILVSRTHRVLTPVSERVRTYIRRPDYRDQMGYQHRVLTDLDYVVHRFRGKASSPRIVVLIDDLDRCPDDKIMDVLQAINLILGETSLYVILGIDTTMIYRAIEAHYLRDGQPLPPRFAETYLQKIIQLPFHLPETRPAERANFVAALFSDAARKEAISDTDAAEGASATSTAPARNGDAAPLEWNRDALDEPPIRTEQQHVEDTPIELRGFLDFQTYLRDNPRELKRLVNVHRFVKIVLKQEGRPPSPELQRKLVKWLIFCARWPDLVDDVLAQARDHPDQADCVAHAVGDVDETAAEFAALAGPDDRLTSADLAPDGTLAKAASISQLIVWETATKGSTGAVR